MAVEFTDNSSQVINSLEEAVIDFLYEAGGEVQAQAKRNSRPVKYGRHDVKNSWDYGVDEKEREVSIGSPLEAAFWEELGTGEYALNGDGRKGWWVYVEGNENPSSNQKYYTESEAKRAAAYLRSKGLPAHATNGTKPNRPLLNAYTSLKPAIERQAQKVLKGKMNE